MGDGSQRTEETLQSLKRWKDASPERNRVWTGPVGTRMKKVSVVYYLSRNGHLEHPHFMEVPLSCPDGLYLKDVISRLNLLRGTGMGRMYSWSSKRSFKNGFVWHDLSEDDYIHPVQGLEYVLKGSEIPPLPHAAADDDEPEKSNINSRSLERNQQWSLYNNLHESNASTQTDDDKQQQNQIIELGGSGSGSPPPLDSSPETLESLMKADKRLMVAASGELKECRSERLKASSVLMNLISCGSFSFRACGASAVKDHGLRLISHNSGQKESNAAENGDDRVEEQTSFERVAVEDKEYFSGSVIETQMNEFLHLKRSSSYNADRVYQTKLELAEKREMGSVRAKCIPRKPEASLTLTKSTTKKDSPNDVARLS